MMMSIAHRFVSLKQNSILTFVASVRTPVKSARENSLKVRATDSGQSAQAPGALPARRESRLLNSRWLVRQCCQMTCPYPRSYASVGRFLLRTVWRDRDEQANQDFRSSDHRQSPGIRPLQTKIRPRQGTGHRKRSLWDLRGVSSGWNWPHPSGALPGRLPTTE